MTSCCAVVLIENCFAEYKANASGDAHFHHPYVSRICGVLDRAQQRLRDHCLSLWTKASPARAAYLMCRVLSAWARTCGQ
mmetsp:Transcript_10012/g.22323  ORF Transcript_10012/g.22323 Transcript_10012/m.22323 type:complete len:80 (+) Transcript_10012:196-435(+)